MRWTRNSAKRRNTRRRGLAYLEPLASIGLTIVLGVLFTTALVQYSKLRRETDARRACLLAATAEIDLIRAGLHDLSGVGGEATAESAAGAVTIQVTAEPGGGVWVGLTHVRVDARRRVSATREVSVELSTYVSPESQP